MMVLSRLDLAFVLALISAFSEEFGVFKILLCNPATIRSTITMNRDTLHIDTPRHILALVTHEAISITLCEIETLPSFRKGNLKSLGGEFIISA